MAEIVISIFKLLHRFTIPSVQISRDDHVKATSTSDRTFGIVNIIPSDKLMRSLLYSFHSQS